MEEPLSNADAERAESAAVQINTLVDDGDGERAYTPTEAAIKVAKDLGLEPDMIRLACRGYNNGVVNYQRESATGGILKKFASVPIADAESAIATLYPTKEAMLKAASAVALAGVSDVYDKPPSFTAYKHQPVSMMTKAAVFEPRPEVLSEAKFIKRADVLRGEIKADYDEALHQENALLTAVEKLAQYFLNKPQWSLDEVAYAAHRKYGAAGVELVKFLADKVGVEIHERLPKQAAVETVAPFSLLKTAIDKAAAYMQARRDYFETLCLNRLKIAVYSAELRKAREITPEPIKLFKAAKPQRQTSWTDAELKKIAGNMAGWMMAPIAAKNMSSMMALKPQSKLVAETLEKLSDPDHEAELRRIRTEGMLHDFLNNDAVLSTQDPGELIDSFNDLSSMAPRVAAQPGAARPVMRKWLSQGQVEPFEANEVATLEKTLMQSQGRGGSGASVEEEQEKQAHGSVLFVG